MNNAQALHLKQSAVTCQKLIALLGELEQQNALYYGAANYDDLITQDGIDQSGAFDGLPLATVQAAQAAKANILVLLRNAVPALSELAAY